jgi:hypothetical protein
MSDVDSAGGASEEEPVSTKQRAEEEEYNPEGECRVRKKRAPAKQREWIEYGRWDRDSFTQEDIDTKIGNIMNELNRDAGLTTIRGSHKDRKSLYGDFQFRREWFSHKGLIHNMVGSCPMRDRCGCQCEAKIVKDATRVVLSIANAHTTDDHEEEEGIKFLTHKQKCLVAHAVKIAPMQTARQLLQNSD